MSSHIPEGMHTVTQHLVCAGAAKAFDFHRKAFGARSARHAMHPPA